MNVSTITSLDNVNFSISGEGVPLLLVNGQFMRLSSWSSILEDLSRYYRVIIIEFPNQGSSPKNENFNNILNYANFLKDVLQILDVDLSELVVHGISFGANVIRSMILDLKLKFKAAILSGVPPINLKNYLIEHHKNSFNIYKKGGLEVFAKYLCFKIFSPQYIQSEQYIIDYIIKLFDELYKFRPKCLETLLKAPINYYENSSNMIQKFNCPVHLISAKEDMIIPLDCAKEYAEAIDAESFHEINGGHLLIQENKLEYIKLLHELVEKYE